MIRIVFLFLIVLQMTACDKIVTERIGVSVDTNAYYTAYQKSPNEPWNKINFNNTDFSISTLSFTVDELTDPYAVVFVCPSKRRDTSHKVFVYYATAAEMTLLDFSCKKPPQDILQSAMYGTISGVTPATLSNPQGELVHVALSSTQSLAALEAFAANVPIGTRDVVAMKGVQSTQGNFIEEPKQFAILRGFKSLSDAPQKADFGFDEGSAYTANFDSTNRSSVTVSGVNDTDTLLTEVGFLSRNKSVLTLVSTNQPALSFIPVPLDEFTSADIGGFFNVNEFQPNEGHELSATVTGVDGKIEREVRKFFTRSDATHNLVLPQPITTVPTFSLSSVGALQKIEAVWSEYKDDVSGDTQLYRWVFDGVAGKLTGENLPDVEITKLQWIVHATPGWLNSTTRTVGTFSFPLPIKYDSVAVQQGKNVDVWSDAWSFQANTPVDWELSTFSTDEKGSSGAVIEYLLNRNIVENYRFSQAYLRSTVTP